MKRILSAAFVLCAAAIVLPAQTFTRLHSFDGAASEGEWPLAALIQGTDGNFYGTTYGGGATHFGTVYKMSPSGKLATLYTFCTQADLLDPAVIACLDGATPAASLVQRSDGDFYGTTFSGGANAGGTIFRITGTGTFTTLYRFCSQNGCPDGSGPLPGLVQAADGDLYGTTVAGGTHTSGTVFRITPRGMLTTLYSFGSQSGDGANAAGLVQGIDGNFYGTTVTGGTNNGGTIFKVTPSGTLTTLYSFCSRTGCTDGKLPYAGLVQAANGNFYGTTSDGGSGANHSGTVFEITTSGTLTTLYNFCSQSGCTDGQAPRAGLIQGSDGAFYGTTKSGGANNRGTVFEITPNGALTTVYSFCALSRCADGEVPAAGLVQATNGKLYAATKLGGAHGNGMVFSVAVGVDSFVEAKP